MIAASYQQLLPYIDDSQLTDQQLQTVKASWPGPVTWVMPVNKPKLIGTMTKHIERCIRAFNPWPMSYFSIEESDSKQSNVKVWQSRVETTLTAHTPGKIISPTIQPGIYIATGKDILVLEQLQIPGKKALSVQDTLNVRAHWFEVGNQLN